MEKLMIEPEPRFRLERLCDDRHPEEVGGYIFGRTVEGDSILKDVFPVPNVIEGSKKRTTYRKHEWGDHWSTLFGASTGLIRLGEFHTHPNGTVPSAQDMRACPGLHLWVIHHSRGEHTFVSARDYVNLEVVLVNESHEVSSKPRLIGGRLELGMAVVNQTGQIDFDGFSRKVLELKNNTRRILLLALSYVDRRRFGRDEVELELVVDKSGFARSTVLKHLNELVKQGLLEKPYRGTYEIPEEWFS